MLMRFLWIPLLFISLPVHADIYRYIDDGGVMHLSDTPQPGYVKFIEDGKPSAKTSPSLPEVPPETIERHAERGAKKMEKALRSMSKRFSIRSYTECSVTDGPPSPHPACKMTFPVTHDMKQIHKIEGFVLSAAREFARGDGAGDFQLVAVMNGNGDKAAAQAAKESAVKGDFAPICGYVYYRQFDQLYPLGPAL